MSTWKLVKLKFGRNLAHFGELGIGLEETSDRVRSDTLFSAWISAYARLFRKDEVEELLQLFLTSQEPPVRMSSTFIYRQDKGNIYYLPRPLAFPLNYPADGEADEDKGDLRFLKAYKKLNYLPLEVWQRWYQGDGFSESDRLELIERTNTGKSHGNLDKTGTFDYKEAFKIGKVPKIAVDRVTRATNLYHTGFVQFRCDDKNDFKSLSGLYFLIRVNKAGENLLNKLQSALHLLGEEGLGGERSSGAGRFEVKWLELPDIWNNIINPSKSFTHHCLISLFWDDKDSITQLNTEKSSYEIQERGGWIASPSSGRQLRRQMIRMFAEGSVFPSLPQGKLADVTPQQLMTANGEYKLHPFYRSGISLSLPIQVQDK